MAIQRLDSSRANINLDGNVAEYVDFGGRDTYTILPNLTGDVVVNDNDAGIVNLPTGLEVSSALFLADGLRLEIGGHTVTFLGAPGDNEYIFGGTPLDPAAGPV